VSAIPFRRARHLASFVVAMSCAAVAHATSGPGSFDMSWWRIASGGGVSSGGAFVLSGTVGQGEVGATTLTGGTFSLTGGFWAGVQVAQWVAVPPQPPAPAPVMSLRGFATNPVRADRLQVEFSLAHDGPASLELLDVSGRRVSAYEVGLLGAGRHTLDMGAGAHVAPGLYWLRLTQAAERRTIKAVVVR
jgi:hypothetical protein